MPSTGDRLLELIRRVFIFRDNIEVMGTERAAQRRFAELIEDVPSDHGKLEVLRYLADCFPLEAHFHAHLGRLLSLNKEYDEALDCVDHALSIQGDDHVLHHMRGMILRQKLRTQAEKQAPLEDLVNIAREATESFGEARRLRPDQEHGYISEVQTLIHLVDYAGKNVPNVVRDVLARSGSDPFLREALERAEDLLDRVHRLYAGEEPSRYFQECRARIEAFYGNYQTALQAWDNLLSRPEVAKPPVRRQIVWAILRRRSGVWNNVSNRETDRIQRLLEENLEEEVNDSTSLRLWLRAVRQSRTPPSLDSVIERVSYWKVNTGSLDAAYYLYVLHTLRALKGSSQGAADADRALDECRRLSRLRRDRTRSFEWIGEGEGIETLVHQSRLGSWVDDFWDSAGVLVRLNGRISSIGGPQKGYVELYGGIQAFFVPAKSGFQSGRHENVPVNCYLGFIKGLRVGAIRQEGNQDEGPVNRDGYRAIIRSCGGSYSKIFNTLKLCVIKLPFKPHNGAPGFRSPAYTENDVCWVFAWCVCHGEHILYELAVWFWALQIVNILLEVQRFALSPLNEFSEVLLRHFLCLAMSVEETGQRVPFICCLWPHPLAAMGLFWAATPALIVGPGRGLPGSDGLLLHRATPAPFYPIFGMQKDSTTGMPGRSLVERPAPCSTSVRDRTERLHGPDLWPCDTTSRLRHDPAEHPAPRRT